MNPGTRTYKECSKLLRDTAWTLQGESNPEVSRRSLLSAGIQSVELLLELLEFLPGFAELAFGGEALVVGKIFRGSFDERVEIGRTSARRRRRCPRRLGGDSFCAER